MEAQKELKKWMAEYKKANTAEKLADHKTRFRAFLNSLSEEDKKEFVAVFQEAAKKTVKESKEIVKTINARSQLQDVLDFTSMSYIAKNYFGKSRQWLYQRINESVVNGNKRRSEKIIYSLIRIRRQNERCVQLHKIFF